MKVNKIIIFCIVVISATIPITPLSLLGIIPPITEMHACVLYCIDITCAFTCVNVGITLNKKK